MSEHATETTQSAGRKNKIIAPKDETCCPFDIVYGLLVSPILVMSSRSGNKEQGSGLFTIASQLLEPLMLIVT